MSGAGDPPVLGTLDLRPATDRPELLAAPVRAAVAGFPGLVFSAPIEPEFADTAAFCAAYRVPSSSSVNCVVVSGRRGGVERTAAAVLLATTRLDVNGVLRRHLDVRKLSFAPVELAVVMTGMEYGGITPLGLPADWPVLIDAAVPAAGPVVIGAGRRAAKIVVDGRALVELPGAEVVTALAV